MVKITRQFSNMEAIEYDPFQGPEISCVIGCTEPQVEILTACMLGGNDASLAFNESVTLKLTGNLDRAALETAFQQLIVRHESLRCAFSFKNKQVCIFKNIGFTIEWKDILHEDEVKKQSLLKDLAGEDAMHLFDLVYGPLLKATIIKTNETEHFLLLTAHHIVCDGWSLGIILQDLGKLYSSISGPVPVTLPTPAMFSKYAQQQLEFLKSAAYAETEKYWLGQFNKNVPVLNLPTDFTRPNVRTYKSNRLDYILPNDLITGLKEVAVKSGCSFVTTLMAAFETFLFCLTGQQHIVLGLPAAGQSIADDSYLVGHCVNLLPLRSNPTADISFADYLKKRRPAIFDAYEHQQLTFGSLLKKLKIDRDPSRIPLVPVVFNIDMGMDDKVEFYGLSHKLSSNPRAYENFEIFLNISGSANNVTLEWSYNTQLFKAETIERLMISFEHLLKTISKTPAVLLGNIEIATSHTDKQISNTIKQIVNYPKDKTIVDLLEEQVNIYPDNIAVVYENQQINYRYLNERANQLAHHLISIGVTAETLIPVCLERGIDMIVAMIAILKAGCAYVPIDPVYPTERISFMMEDTGATLFVCNKSTLGVISISNVATPIIIDQEDLLATAYNHNAAIDTKPHQLAYIIYTSGSTGMPKGVMIEHRNVVRLFKTDQPLFDFSSQDVWTVFHSFSFDFSVWEMYGALLYGGRMVVVPVHVTKDVTLFAQLIVSQKVTVLNQTPSAFYALRDEVIRQTDLTTIRYVIFGGEALNPSKLSLWKKAFPPTKLINMYGITETTVHVTYQEIGWNEINAGKSVIGKPIPTLFTYILDSNQKPVPIGVAGELLIGGAGLARGYLNRTKLTTEKFIADTFSNDEGARLYKSGDLGRMLDDGSIEYLGRIDDQVKIRGYRIEPGEIENALEALPGIQNAVVLCKLNKLNDPRLIAYIVPASTESNQEISADVIEHWKKQLGSKLPSYMIPVHFEILTSFPLTGNGKVDKKALPEPKIYTTTEEKEETKLLTPQEKFIAGIWKELLDLDDVGLNDNFFQLGGHSLVAIEVMARIEKENGIRLSPSVLFQFPTVAGLAAALNDASRISKWQSLVPIKPDGNKSPVYIVHGTGLDVMVFNNIAKHMDEEQPVFGLKAKGLENEQDAFASIEEMAGFYISEILQQNPNGPYCLLGFSAGSVIAFEMARQLKIKNKQVKMVGVIDFDLRELEPRGNFITIIKRKLTRLLPWSLHLLRSFVYYPNKAYQYQVMCLKLRYSTLLIKLGFERIAPKEEIYIRMEKVQNKFEFALRQYILRPQEIRLDLFSTKIKVYYLVDPKYLSWKPLALKGIKIHKVPGDHDDMILPPNDKQFAIILQQVLDNV